MRLRKIFTFQVLLAACSPANHRDDWRWNLVADDCVGDIEASGDHGIGSRQHQRYGAVVQARRVEAKGFEIQAPFTAEVARLRLYRHNLGRNVRLFSGEGSVELVIDVVDDKA